MSDRTAPKAGRKQGGDVSDAGTGNGKAAYSAAVARFRRTVCGVVPPDATVSVISKGDRKLLDLPQRRGWHFPQRADGVYAGYYPPDDATAIRHLETLRERGADFFAIPAAGLWWLDYYPDFARHLEERYRRVFQDEETGALFALVEPAAQPRPKRAGAESPPPAPRPTPVAHSALEKLVDPAQLDDLRELLATDFYGEQAGVEFTSRDDALRHYLREGYTQRLDPHPLFDTRWYLEHEPRARAAGINPLIHFLEHSVREGQDPNPFFDTEFYYGQGDLRSSGGNALVHYIKHAPEDRAYRPNPLFGGAYYLRTYPDAKAAGWAPLEHYLLFGAAEGRYVSALHENLVKHLHGSGYGGLTRGNWRRGSVLLFGYGERSPDGLDLPAIAQAMVAEHRLDPLLVLHRRAELAEQLEAAYRLLVLEDYAMAAEIFRPSALRMVALTLGAMRPLFAVSEVAEVLEVLGRSRVGTYYVPSPTHDPEGEELRRAYDNATRVLVSSPAAFHAAARRLGHYPPRVARRSDALPAVLEFATRDLGIHPRITQPPAAAPRRPTRKVLVPCSDWNVSGVNASLEALGQELAECGWNVEIVFTRDEATVLESAGDRAHLPRLPHRFLERNRSGLDGMWEALIADLQMNAPCIAFLGYDFMANSVVPALTEDVGVVSWVQADDGDYYEQAYRLGRYCNRVVCVSSRIGDQLATLNPVIGERARVIHNSSVWEHDILTRRPRRSDRLRIVYAGRLVQYQKRVLDYLHLAAALDAAGVPYEITLIGSFVAREGIQDQFERRARAHLDDGRIKLLGRLPREQILAELSEHDFYVLLSDFEGLPLALVEAMARGCVPVVPGIASGIPELITNGHDGVIVDHRNYDAWAAVLEELWRDRRGLAAMSRRVRTTVRRRLTVERVGRQFDELLSEVAEEIASGTYERPAALTWGTARSPTGDVLPPPSIHRPALLKLAGLR
jgi:glycosyltransferase involved in cell wall biosynthesis